MNCVFKLQEKYNLPQNTISVSRSQRKNFLSEGIRAFSYLTVQCEINSSLLIASLRNHNATDDDNVDFKLFRKVLHLSLRK